MENTRLVRQKIEQITQIQDLYNDKSNHQDDGIKISRDELTAFRDRVTYYGPNRLSVDEKRRRGGIVGEAYASQQMGMELKDRLVDAVWGKYGHDLTEIKSYMHEGGQVVFRLFQHLVADRYFFVEYEVVRGADTWRIQDIYSIEAGEIDEFINHLLRLNRTWKYNLETEYWELTVTGNRLKKWCEIKRELPPK